MVDLAHRSSVLEEMNGYFAAQGWSETDLSRFRMQADPDEDPDDPDDDPKTPELKPEDVAAMQKALKKANKEAEATRLKLKEYEDRDKSETEKLSERTRELEGDLTATQKTALRYEIALDKGIPKSIASRLQGDTREEMEKDADELLTTLGGVKKTPSFDGGAKDGDAPAAGSFLSKALRDRRTA